MQNGGEPGARSGPTRSAAGGGAPETVSFSHASHGQHPGLRLRANGLLARSAHKRYVVWPAAAVLGEGCWTCAAAVRAGRAPLSAHKLVQHPSPSWSSTPLRAGPAPLSAHGRRYYDAGDACCEGARWGSGAVGGLSLPEPVHRPRPGPLDWKTPSHWHCSSAEPDSARRGLLRPA